MRVKAKITISGGGKTFAPGTVFTTASEEEAKRLLSIQAVEEVEEAEETDETDEAEEVDETEEAEEPKKTVNKRQAKR